MGELDSALIELEKMKIGNEFFWREAAELIEEVEGIRG